MIVLWIVLAIIALLILLILLGTAKIHIVYRQKLRVSISILGIRYTPISDKEPKEKKQKALESCRNPDKVLKKELKRQTRAAKKAEKKRLKAKKKALKKKKRMSAGTQAAPNLKENLEMILAILKKLYEVTRGRIRIKFRQMHIIVASEDAAKTAILYGVIIQSVSYILNFVEEKFAHVKRKPGAMYVDTDFAATQCKAEIDLICKVKIRHALSILVSMLTTHAEERSKAYKKAALREKEAREQKLK